MSVTRSNILPMAPLTAASARGFYVGGSPEPMRREFINVNSANPGAWQTLAPSHLDLQASLIGRHREEGARGALVRIGCSVHTRGAAPVKEEWTVDTEQVSTTRDAQARIVPVSEEAEIIQRSANWRPVLSVTHAPDQLLGPRAYLSRYGAACTMADGSLCASMGQWLGLARTVAPDPSLVRDYEHTVDDSEPWRTYCAGAVVAWDYSWVIQREWGQYL